MILSALARANTYISPARFTRSPSTYSRAQRAWPDFRDDFALFSRTRFCERSLPSPIGRHDTMLSSASRFDAPIAYLPFNISFRQTPIASPLGKNIYFRLSGQAWRYAKFLDDDIGSWLHENASENKKHKSPGYRHAPFL